VNNPVTMKDPKKETRIKTTIFSLSTSFPIIIWRRVVIETITHRIALVADATRGGNYL
jgi:hypothetical protein